MSQHVEEIPDIFAEFEAPAIFLVIISLYMGIDIHRQQPRELLLQQGSSVLSDRQLLMVLIGSGVSGNPVGAIADEVLKVLDHGRNTLTLDTIRDIHGLGNAKKALLIAAFELARRVLCPKKWKIILPGDVLPVIERFADRTQEHFLCVSLNGAHEVIQVHVVSVGLVNRTIVHPREVFAEAITKRAASIIVAHNHPSGNVDPSYEDRQVTHRLTEAGEMLGIPVLDHIVFSDDGYYSFAEHGEMDNK